MEDTMIGVDLAKSVFQLHGTSKMGELKFRKKLSRPQFHRFMADHPPAVVVMEACGSAHYWSREMIKFGHEVKLIAPQYVRPFVKRQKNDANDAEAIVVAAQRPEMRFVEPKSESQQARAVLFRARERLVHQRTELVNALRAVLYEHGHSFPIGIGQLKRINTLLDDKDNNLSALVHEECVDLLVQIAEKTARIDTKTKKVKTLSAKTDMARPGTPLTVLSDGEPALPNLIRDAIGGPVNHILDWWHISMRVRHIEMAVRGLIQTNGFSGIPILFQQPTESLRWHLWHGHVRISATHLHWLIFDCARLAGDNLAVQVAAGRVRSRCQALYTYSQAPLK